MAYEPLGIAAYNGLAVPVNGESEIRQFDSSRTILTLTHSTANTGRFLTFRNNRLPNSTLSNADLLWVDSSGALLGGKGAVELASTASTAITLTTANSGKTYVVNGQSSGSKQVLPVPEIGLRFRFIQSTGHTSHAMQISRDSSATDILFAGGGNSTLPSTAAFARPATTVTGMAAEFIAISATRWLCIPALNSLDGTSATGELSGGWVAVTS